MNEAQLKFVFNKIGYNPSPEQWAIHADQHRVRLVTGGERGGKSYSGANDCFARSFEGNLFWLAAVDYERTRAEFQYICEAHDKMGIQYSASKRVDPGEIVNELGVNFKTKSLKDPRTIAMEAPDGILVCEAATIDYESYLRLRGRLAEKRAWMLMTGTLESSLGWYVDLYNLGQTESNVDNLRSFALPTWANLTVFPGGRDDPELKMIEAQMPHDWFMERFGGQPCPPKGLVFPEFKMNEHVVDDERTRRDPTIPVYLWVDPGYQHAYAILAVQNKGDYVAIIDEVYERGLVTEDMISECRKRPWWKYVPQSAGAIDIAATQHQALSSVLEVWFKKGGKSLRTQKIKIKDGIERVKMALKINPQLGHPSVLIHPTCRGLISELGGCPNPLDGQSRFYQWKTNNTGQVVGDVPEDKNNDACFDKQSEILTDEGWKLFSNLTRNEKVATRNSLGFIEYQTPTRYYTEKFNGNLVLAETKGVNFAVTPNHQLFVANQYSVAARHQYKHSYVSEPRFSLVEAAKIPYSCWISRVGKWEGKDREWVIYQQRHKPTTISSTKMARFIGLWLGEGSKEVKKGILHIDQKNRVAEVERIIADLGLHYFKRVSKTGVWRFTISCKQLCNIVAEQGVSYNKTIPREFLSLPPEALQALIEGLWVGEGSIDKETNTRTIYSSSYKLLSDAQEALFKIGTASNLHDYSYLQTNPKYHGIYQLIIPNAGGQLKDWGLTTLLKKNTKPMPYNDIVYCVEVPNGVICTRRNGKVMWVGNCKAFAYGIVDMLGYAPRMYAPVKQFVTRRTKCR